MHDNSTGYINASNIKISIARETCHYVAAQGPMENTVKDWWRMVWEKGINVIAMLTKVEVSFYLAACSVVGLETQSR